jgi:peptidoglycan hydrolase-like protein with peptidoglycan-binding domain
MSIITSPNLKKVAFFALFLTLALGLQTAQAAITTQLDVGSMGSDVRELQTYLAGKPALYPSGLVTGYFGSLTQGGTEKFQTSQGIITSGTPETTGYGRVGPKTMTSLNGFLGADLPAVYIGAAPTLSGLMIETNSTNATINWSTNEPATGQLFYDTMPLNASEATGPRQLPYVSGASLVDNGLQYNHRITIMNLRPGTLYYYLVRSVNGAGNMSMSQLQSFRTN